MVYENSNLSTSIIIPTYNRHSDLLRLLNSLVSLKYQPDEILVVVGPDDSKSFSILDLFKNKLVNLNILHSEHASVIYALNLGLSKAKGQILCLLDDDVTVPNDWLIKIVNKFVNYPDLGGYGGRDKLQIRNIELSNPAPCKVIGKFNNFGNLAGNHHCGSIFSSVSVDVLKGCNLSIRSVALRQIFIDEKLQYFGAEPCWEIDLCQNIIKNGFNLLYENENYVDHFVGKRSGEDNRVNPITKYTPNRAYNMAYVIGKHRPFSELFFFSLKSVLFGSRKCPGFFWTVLNVRSLGFNIIHQYFRIIKKVVKGAVNGVQTRNKY